jgi:putative transposase
VKGRKRHIAVDSQGLLVRVVSHPCHIADRLGARLLVLKLKSYVQVLQVLLADGAYNGSLAPFVEQHLGCRLELALSPATWHSGWYRHPKRWIVERTFAWLGFQRRLSLDYEALPLVSESFVYLAAINLLLHRLHPEH